MMSKREKIYIGEYVSVWKEAGLYFLWREDKLVAYEPDQLDELIVELAEEADLYEKTLEEERW